MTRSSSQDVSGGEYAPNKSRYQTGEVTTSGDELIKVRKPYTITKQRERWTEEEHQKFLEALKLYGRAWRRIEEHIGTKTAVQIRSHAQKFFSKLEREQASGGSTAQDIDIPPPRPKRKPSHPYPRKATAATFDSPMSSPAALPPSLPGLLVRPTLTEGIRSTSPMEMGKVFERCKAELKLFGQTVLVPTANGPVAVLEGKVQGNADGSELQEAGHPDISKMQIASTASDVSMLVSEHDSSSNNKTKMENRTGPVPYCETPSSMHRFGEDPQSLNLALHYSKFWESFQTAEAVYPFNSGMDTNFWQGYCRAVAAVWPSFPGASLNEVTRTIMAGASPEALRTDNSPAALAAATIAAASAWWALQGSVPPSFHAQRVPPTTENRGHTLVPVDTQGQEVDKMELENDALPQDDDDTIASPIKTDKTVHQSFKRQGSCFEGVDGGKKRVKLRSFENDDKALPPSSSGSDDGNERVEPAEQMTDAYGNSGPSSNSSRCGTDQATVKSDESSSEKERTEGEGVTDELPKTPKDSSFQHSISHHYNSHTHRSRKSLLRPARPCRSSGSDGERKEVSQEGRIAFQALFSHGSKLPQSFFQKVYPNHPRGPPLAGDGSDLESVNYHGNNSNNFIINNNNNSNNRNNSVNNINNGPLRLESVASDDPVVTSPGKNEECKTKAAVNSQQLTSGTRRRSGFVPYRRAVEGGGVSSEGVKAASCRLEESQLVNIPRLVDEEVKASCS